MNFTIERKDKIAIFTLKQSTVSSEVSAKLKAELLILCQPNIDALVMDLSQVVMLDSSGLGALLLAHRQLNEHAIPIILAGVQGMVQTIMNISQIEQLFTFADSVDDALVFLEGESS